MIYSQNDPRWAGQPLGHGGATIGEAGCFITSFANCAAKLGHNIDPFAMNNQFIANNWFVNNCEVSADKHNALALLWPDLEFIAEQHWDGAADLSFFDDAGDPSVATIVMIDVSQQLPGVQTHFTMVDRRAGNDVIINDSWDGMQKSITWYGADAATVIYAAYKYRLKAKEDDMLKMEDTDVMRIILSVLGTYDYGAVHEGKYDASLQSDWVGKSPQDMIRAMFTQNAGVIIARAQAHMGMPALKAQLEKLQSSVSDRKTLDLLTETVARLTDLEQQQTELMSKIVNKEPK